MNVAVTDEVNDGHVSSLSQIPGGPSRQRGTKSSRVDLPEVSSDVVDQNDGHEVSVLGGQSRVIVDVELEKLGPHLRADRRDRLARVVAQVAVTAGDEDDARRHGATLRHGYGIRVCRVGRVTAMETGREDERRHGVVAFFDVDNTIIRGASAYHIARGLRRRGFFTRRAVLRFAWEQAKYLTFGESARQMTEVREEALSIIKGWSVAEMTSIAEDVYDEVLALRIFPGTKKLLDKHLEKGHEVWLVTASPVEVGRMIARRLGATGALGTIAAHERGHYTGALVGDLMHGENKATAVRELAKKRGLDLTHSYGYGDSLNDVPLLETVGNPCAINPDIRLRRYAKRRGWDLRDFRGRKGNGRRSIAARTTAGAIWMLLAVFRVLKRTLVGAIRGLFRRR